MKSSLLDHPLLNERLFFPRPARFSSPFRVETEGATLACAYHRADPAALTVVHFHGNGEVVADYLDGGMDWLTSRGHNLLLAEYRGYGMSTGEPRLARMLDDVPRVLEATGVDPRRIVVFGRSIGSLFAVEAAARWPEVAGVILESGIADVLERLLVRLRPDELSATAEELALAVRERLDQPAKIAAYGGPVLILHAVHDDLVSVSHAEQLAAAAGARGTLSTFERGSHNSIFVVNHEEYMARVESFLAKIANTGRSQTPR